MRRMIREVDAVLGKEKAAMPSPNILKPKVGVGAVGAADDGVEDEWKARARRSK